MIQQLGAVNDMSEFLLRQVEQQMVKFYKFMMDYTIIRPGGLITAPATGTGELTADTTKAGVIHRADVAALVVKAMDDKSTVKKTFSAIDFATTTAQS